MRREGRQPAGDAVVEARAHRDHQIAIVHRHIGFVEAVHADHADRQFVGAGKAAQAHQGLGAGKAGQVHQLGQRLGRRRPGIDHPAADIEERLPSIRHQLDRGRNRLQVRLGARPIALVALLGRTLIGAGGDQNILGQVHQHRAGPAVRRHVKGLVHHAGKVVDVLHQIIVLGAGPGDAGGVGLLERVVADQMGRHLAGQADHRDRIAQRVEQAGHRVGGAGARGHQHHAHLAGRARIALGGMHGRLFVAHQDMAQPVLLEQLVIQRKDRAARIAENHLDALVDQRAQDDLRSVQHFLGHRSTRFSAYLAVPEAFAALQHAAGKPVN